MNARELIQELEELEGETEVRFMHQPSYPLEVSIASLWSPESREAQCVADENEKGLEYRPCGVWLERDPGGRWVHEAEPEWEHRAEEDPNDETWAPSDAPGPVVYLTEGTFQGYGTGKAWEAR